MDTTPTRGKTTAKSNKNSYAPKGQTAGDITLTPDNTPPITPKTRNLIQLSGDLGLNKTRAVPKGDGIPTTADLAKRSELQRVVKDIDFDLGKLANGNSRRLIARYGRVIGVESDGPEVVNGFRFQKNYEMLIPKLNSAYGREWHARLFELGVLNENVDSNSAANGGIGSISYHVEPIK